jgi:hypothetical protein
MTFVISCLQFKGFRLRNYIIYLLLFLITLSSCAVRYGGGSRSGRVKTSAPSGKYRNPTIFSRINPFQGRAKARLAKSKRKKNKLFKRRRKLSRKQRKGRKPGSSFDSRKKKISRGRLRGSGSRSKSGGGNKKNKKLFNTKKK